MDSLNHENVYTTLYVSIYSRASQLQLFFLFYFVEYFQHSGWCFLDFNFVHVVLYENHCISQNWVKVKIEDFVQFKKEIKSLRSCKVFRNLKYKPLLDGSNLMFQRGYLH